MSIPDLDHAKLDVSRETFEKLTQFVDLLEKWTKRINLVSSRSLENVWTRHIHDSLQLLHATDLASTWCDIGSGGGLPGIVVAIAAPQTEVTLIESDQRKATFLRTVVHQLELNSTVHAQRIEMAKPAGSHVLSARALADLNLLLAYAERHLKEDGVALFPKGRTWKNELEDAQRHWRFQYEIVQSATEAEAVILKIRGLSRV